QVLCYQTYTNETPEHTEPLRQVCKALVPAQQRQIQYGILSPGRVVQLPQDVRRIKSNAFVLGPVINAAEVVNHSIPLVRPPQDGNECRNKEYGDDRSGHNDTSQ